MNKAHGIKTENFEDLIKQMNEFSSKNETFASNIYPDFTEKHKVTFYAVIYYKSNEPNEIPKKEEKTPQNTPKPQIKGINKQTREPKKISDNQIKTLMKWSQEEEGKEYLESKNIKSEKDILNLTSKEAWEIIKEGFERKNEY